MLLSLKVRKSLDRFSLDIDMCIPDGITVLLGPSGSGKSTLLNLIAGILEPDNGEIAWGSQVLYRRGDMGSPVALPVNLRRFGYVFQHSTLFPHLTVRQNIVFGLGRGDPGAADMAELISLLRLEGLEDRYPREISGGQAQRVELARALIIRPRMLLLDEPFSALDNLIRSRLRQDLLKVLRKYRIPCIFVTHDLEEAYALGDRVAVMDEGRVLRFGTPADVYQRPGSRKVARFVGMRNIFDGVVERVSREGVLVRGEKFNITMNYYPVKEHQEVVFGIRPEKVLYLPPENVNDGRENVIRATILNMQPDGPMDRVYLRVAGDAYDLEMLLPGNISVKRGLQAGDFVNVSLPMDSLHLLGEDLL